MKTRNYIVIIILFMALICAFAMIEYREVQELGDVSVAERSNDDKSIDGLAHPPITYAEFTYTELQLQEMRKEQQVIRKEIQHKEDEFIYDDHQRPWQGRIRHECKDLDEYYLWPRQNNMSPLHIKR